MENSDKRYDSSGGIIQALFKSEGVDSNYKDTLLIEVVKACLNESRYDLAINLWVQYEPILIYYNQKLIPSIISSIEDSSHAWEFKLYFLKKFYTMMNYEEQKRVLIAIYKAIMSEDEDVKLAYLRNNLNPLRNSMQLKDTLAFISEVNPRAEEQVGNISDALDDILLDYLNNPTLNSKIIRM